MAKISINDVGSVISNYIEQSVLPKATGVQKFFTALAAIAMADQSEKLASAYEPLLDMLGISSGGHIDIVKLHDYASKAIAKVGKFEYAGVIFGAEDVEDIMRIAERYAQ